MGDRQVPQHRPLRHRRRPVRDRRRRRRAPVLQQARAGPDAARGRDAGRHAAGALDVLAGAQPERDQEAPQRGAGQDGRARLHLPRDRAQGDEEGPRAAHGALLPEGPRALRPRLRPVRADQGVRRARTSSAAATRSTRRSTSRSRRRRAPRSPTSSPASARPPRSSRSTPPTATSSRWPPPQQYGKSKFNLAAQGHRQPGSSFKIDGAPDRAARGREPELDELRVEGADGARRPAVRLARRARGRSRPTAAQGAAASTSCAATLASDNSVYAQLTSDLGPDKVKETARMMGIKSKLNGFCAESLGGLEDGVSPLEMASAYATIANGGYRNRPRMIKKVVDREGKTVKLPTRWRVHRIEGLLGRRDLRGDQDPASRTSRAARARTPTSAARPAARPARPTRTSTPGSSASRRGCRPPSGSASPARPRPR